MLLDMPYLPCKGCTELHACSQHGFCLLAACVCHRYMPDTLDVNTTAAQRKSSSCC